MTALVKGDVVFPLSNHAWMSFRSYEWWSPATTGSTIRSWEIGHSMNLGQSLGKTGVVIFRIGERAGGKGSRESREIDLEFCSKKEANISTKNVNVTEIGNEAATLPPPPALTRPFDQNMAERLRANHGSFFSPEAASDERAQLLPTHRKDSFNPSSPNPTHWP